MFPFVLVDANTLIAVVLIVRYACSTVLTRPTVTQGLQRHKIANLFQVHGRIITTITRRSISQFARGEGTKKIWNALVFVFVLGFFSGAC